MRRRQEFFNENLGRDHAKRIGSGDHAHLGRCAFGESLARVSFTEKVFNNEAIFPLGKGWQ